MTTLTHKRKASLQLTRNSVESVVNLEYHLESDKMNTILSNALCKAWSWCASWFAYSTMSYTPVDIVADTHIQRLEEREDGITSVKRRKKRGGGLRSKSLNDDRRINQRRGMFKLESVKCATEEEEQRRVEDFYAPPILCFKNPTPMIAAQLPTPDPSEDEGENGSESDFAVYPKERKRRHSEPVVSPPTPESMSTSSRSVSSIRITPTYNTETSQASAARQILQQGLGGLDERMRETLHISDKEKESRAFTPSAFKREQQRKQRERREREAKEEAIRAAKEARLKRRRPLKPLIQPLSPHWEERICNTLRAGPGKAITTAMAGNALHDNDFKTLLGHHAWLNDEMVNGYIDWVLDAANKADFAEVKARGETPSMVPKFMAHNSFFYPNLLKKGPADSERLMKRKKAPGTSILEIDSLFIPICNHNHWTVGVVRPVARTIEYFDSMGGSPIRFVEQMRAWLKHHLGNAYIEEEWKTPRTVCARQNNGWDCGVFVCTNVFCVTLGIDTTCYKEQDMTLQRQNIAAILINRGFTGDFAWGMDGFI